MTSTNPEQQILVRVSRRFNASPERVFDAWLDPERAGKWLFATPTGEMVRVEIDPRIGGGFTIVERRDGELAEHFGTYLEIDRPRRLVFSFSVEKYSVDADRVTVEIAPLESGCELTLTHEMNAKYAEFVDRTQQGWTGILEGLAANLG